MSVGLIVATTIVQVALFRWRRWIGRRSVSPSDRAGTLGAGERSGPHPFVDGADRGRTGARAVGQGAAVPRAGRRAGARPRGARPPGAGSGRCRHGRRGDGAIHRGRRAGALGRSGTRGLRHCSSPSWHGATPRPGSGFRPSRPRSSPRSPPTASGDGSQGGAGAAASLVLASSVGVVSLSRSVGPLALALAAMLLSSALFAPLGRTRQRRPGRSTRQRGSPAARIPWPRARSRPRCSHWSWRVARWSSGSLSSPSRSPRSSRSSSLP